MRGAAISRSEWFTSLKSNIEPVGDCMEWQGKYTGKLPMVYTPAGFLIGRTYHANAPVRRVVYELENGSAPPEGCIIRMKCWNSRCVHPKHFEVMTRSQQVAEQSKRGELVTKSFINARSRQGRAQSKLDPEKVAAIRASTEKAAIEAQKYGVSETTINRVRTGESWANHYAGSSIFTLGQALANFKG